MTRPRRTDLTQLMLGETVAPPRRLREGKEMVGTGHSSEFGLAIMLQRQVVLLGHTTEQVAVASREQQISPLSSLCGRYAEAVERPMRREILRALHVVQRECTCSRTFTLRDNQYDLLQCICKLKLLEEDEMNAFEAPKQPMTDRLGVVDGQQLCG